MTMRLDVARAMKLAQTLDFPRNSGGEGERSAATLLAEEFENAGWRVESTLWKSACLKTPLVVHTTDRDAKTIRGSQLWTVN